jgi:hypothetical protein
VGQDDQVGLLLALGGFALQHRVDRDAVVGQDAGDLGQHAGLVGHAQAQVVGGLHLGDRQDGRVGQRVGLEGQVGTRWSGSAVARRVMSTRSAITAEAVGSAPAPLP